MKIYITKYALTDGIQLVNAEPSKYSPNYMTVKEPYHTAFSEKDYTLTLPEAVKQAYKKRDKKIYSLKAQIDKLEGLTF
jgi:hypothetical protein